MAVPAYVLIPDTYDGSTRSPALVCQHGHVNGKDDVVGIAHGAPPHTFVTCAHQGVHGGDQRDTPSPPSPLSLKGRGGGRGISYMPSPLARVWGRGVLHTPPFAST